MAVKKQFSFLLPGFLLHAVTCCLSRAFHIKYFFALCVGVAVIAVAHHTVGFGMDCFLGSRLIFRLCCSVGPLICSTLDTWRYVGGVWV